MHLTIELPEELVAEIQCVLDAQSIKEWVETAIIKGLIGEPCMSQEQRVNT
jgi:hypothetical protein